jgi:hypothetical protein
MLKPCWPIHKRPDKLWKKKHLKGKCWTLATLLEYKRECEAEKKIKDLGKEICTKDEQPLKVRYKAQSDDGK